MDTTLLFFFGGILLIYMGVWLFRLGLRAIKGKRRPIGPYDPKMNVVSGSALFLGGVIAVIKAILLFVESQ